MTWPDSAAVGGTMGKWFDLPARPPLSMHQEYLWEGFRGREIVGEEVVELCADGGVEGDALVDTTTGGTGGHTRFPTGTLFHRTWPSLVYLAMRS